MLRTATITSGDPTEHAHTVILSLSVPLGGKTNLVRIVMKASREINTPRLTEDQRFQADCLHLVCSLRPEGHRLNMPHLHTNKAKITQ